MLRNRSIQLFLYGVVLIGVLLALPSTGWIVRQQLRVIVGQPLPGGGGYGAD